MSGLPPANWPLTTGEEITPPWYNYLKSADETWRPSVHVYTTRPSGVVEEIIPNSGVTFLSATANSIITFETPRPGIYKTIVYQRGSTQGGPVTLEAATNVAIGPGGENAIRIGSSATTYEYVHLVATSSLQWHILTRSTTTLLAVVASS